MEWDEERLRARLAAYAPYVGAGIRVTRLDLEGGAIDVEMPLTDENRNLVGTHFGGSLYAMVDPHLMILLMARLGEDYVVWDRRAVIEFLRPGRGLVSSRIRVTDGEVEEVRRATDSGAPHRPSWEVEVVDGDGEVVARVEKTLWVKRDIDARG